MPRNWGDDDMREVYAPSMMLAMLLVGLSGAFMGWFAHMLLVLICGR